MSGLVLDSEALSLLIDQRGNGYDDVRAAMTAAYNSGVKVHVPAAVLAEQFTTPTRSHALTAFLARDGGALTIHDTDRRLARKVGELLHNAGRNSADHVDGCVVATCVELGGGLIITSDEADLKAISSGNPRVRVASTS
ncbi:MAG: PIN domain-containing protein [Candidatus Nanopelagicales bacterium]